MPRTLHKYLANDLVKVTLLALVAFTLVMTIFAIIEPLRKRGLATDQVATLFAYTLPVMLSLTLPVAALFAATIVYGRFSQDNELLACRASGLSTFTVLEPAIVLGAAVTVISLALSNYVAPRMVARGARAVEANIRGIAYRELRTENHLKLGRYALHADQVDENTNALRGVVVADASKRDQVRLLTAPVAYVSFDYHGGETYITTYLVNPAVYTPDNKYLGQETSQALPSVALPNPAREEPSWYEWPRLLSTLKHPEESATVLKKLLEIRRDIGHDIVAQQVARLIAASGRYDGLRDEAKGLTYVIEASSARAGDRGEVRLLGDASGPAARRRVTVTVMDGSRVRQRVAADGGSVEVGWSATQRLGDFAGGIKLAGAGRDSSDASLVTIRMKGKVVIEEPPRVDRLSRSEWVSQQLAIPAELRERGEAISPADVYRRPEAFTANSQILGDVKRVNTRLISKLVGKIQAEVHSRVAYGLSCFLLVAMGAALGLMFRGGQMLSAFALSVMPAAAVIVMIIMGKRIFTNPEVPAVYGKVAIWGGISALLCGTAGLYVRLIRR